MINKKLKTYSSTISAMTHAYNNNPSGNCKATLWRKEEYKLFQNSKS